MWRLLLSCLAPLLLVLAFSLPAARAQQGGTPPSTTSPSPAPSSSSEGGGSSRGQEVGVFPWVIAFIFTVLILLVVCMPSRKG
jgi:hypothetical protein